VRESELELRQQLREAKSTIDVLTLERDQLLAVCERERQRVAAETKIEVARGTKATSDEQKP
jgi:hypothetical protein